MVAGSGISLTPSGTDMTIAATGGGGGIDVTGTNNRMVRMHNTDDIQDTGITVDDSNNVSGIGTLTNSGAFTLGSTVSLDENASISTIEASAIQFGVTSATYAYDIHAGYLGSAVITTEANYYIVAPEVMAGTGAVPVTLPDGSSEVGLRVTIVNDTANDPAGALTVSPNGSDVIYDPETSGSNSSVSSVSIGANRGDNKTFVTIAAGVWIVLGGA